MGRDYKFINPYNFIPVGENCIRKQYFGDSFTGYIECELETLTPLIMLDTVRFKEDGDQHKTYQDVFKLDGIPAIPASELRGMIRNKFETLTNSCMSSAQEDLAFIGRYNGNMRNAGLLDFSDPKAPKLYDCRFYKLDDNQYDEIKHLKTGDVVDFDIKDVYIKGRKKQKIQLDKYGEYTGYLKIGELFNKKHACHIFIKDSEVKAENSDDFEKMYKEIADEYKDNLERNHDSYTLSPLKPVWYEKNKNYVYFSLGQNGQTKYRRRLKDVMYYDFIPCNDKENLCEGCQVFGTVKDDIAVGSKVRFEDAYMTQPYVNNYIDKKGLVLEELSGPKFNNALFYMLFYDNKTDKRVNDFTEWNWNVDFFSKFAINKKNNDKNKSNTTDIKDGYIEIRGRKEYWHHKPANKLNVEKTKRNITVDTIKTGVKYTFKVYFDNITKEQLEHLNMAICLENDSSYAHKLGHGKPLGFGSVKIKTKNIVYKNVAVESGKISYNKETYIPQYKKLFDLFNTLTYDQKFAIEQMYDFKFLMDKNIIVDYPRNEKDGIIYEWFESNKNNTEFVGEKRIKQQAVLPFAEWEYDYLIQQGYNSKSKNKGNNYASKGNGKYYK